MPVAFFVMNNGEYRTLKETLDAEKSRASTERDYIGLDLAAPGRATAADWTAHRLDWEDAARFFGVASIRADSTAHLHEIAAGLGGLTGPLLVDVPLASHAEEHGYEAASHCHGAGRA